MQPRSERGPSLFVRASWLTSLSCAPLGVTRQDDGVEMVCEGYLVKLRGFGRNRRRWFQLTSRDIAFYEHDGGALVAITPRDNICAVTDINAQIFTVCHGLLCCLAVQLRRPGVFGVHR